MGSRSPFSVDVGYMTEHILKLQNVAKRRRIPDKMLQRYHEDINVINKPFHFKGDRDVCVMLIHGWTSTPYEMRILGEELQAEGIAVDAPLLSGHGTRPQDLENVTWEQWVDDVNKAYARLRKQYARVYVGGMSMGGNLALHVAKNNEDVSGLILMSTPYKMRYEKLGILMAHMTQWIFSYKKKYYPRGIQAQPSITQLISYQKYPISSAFEAYTTIKNSLKDIERITQPVFLIQPAHDHLVARESIHKIYNKLGSQIKEKRLIKKASHNFMGNGKHKDVFQDVVHFVKRSEQ